MGLTNGVAPENSSEDVLVLHHALVSSFTKWRLAELSQLKEKIQEGRE